MQICAVQLNYKIGDFTANCQKIVSAIKANQNADLVVFSELCLSGYFPKDLIEQQPFILHQQQIFNTILELSKTVKCGIIIGAIGKNPRQGKAFHNSLFLIHQGQIIYTYHKKLLPVYNIFDEARHFAPGNVPATFEFLNTKLGFMICEDGWGSLDNFLYAVDPVAELAKAKCDFIICINGSPSNFGKQQQRLENFANVAKKVNAPLLFTNQVGGNDDIVFDGCSFLLTQQGKALGSLKSFKEDQGCFELNNTEISILSGFNPIKLYNDIELAYSQIILGLSDYIKKCNFNGVVIGLSGGIDSSLTLALAVKALGADKVEAITMPTRYSSKGSVEDSIQLCKNLKVKLHNVSIDAELDLALTRFASAFNQIPKSLTEQNIQARIRGRLLMEYSNQTGLLVLSTGNKSELSVGYTTLYGDMTGGFNIIGDLYKTEVYQLAEHFNTLHPNQQIPAAILEKEPSAELAPNQKDTDNLLPYEVLDPILKTYIEGDLLPLEAQQQLTAKMAKLPLDTINKVQDQVDNAEFKRRQAPPIVRVQRRAFGYGRQLPIAAKYPKHE